MYRTECLLRKNNSRFILSCTQFALTLKKLSCTSARKIKMKKFSFYFILHSVCINSEEVKLHFGKKNKNEKIFFLFYLALSLH